MPGGVEDVDLHAFPDDGAVLGFDGDPALPLEVHAVHNPLLGLLSRSEHARLLEHGVDEGRFPMVDMGDDGDITDRRIGCVCEGHACSWFRVLGGIRYINHNETSGFGIGHEEIRTPAQEQQGPSWNEA